MVPVAVSRAKDGQRTLVETGDTTDLVCEMVLLALGFDGVETAPLLTDLDVGTDPLGRIECDVGWQTRTPGVFVCGDAHRGASLVVRAIAEGRSAARDSSTCFSQASRRFRLRFIQRHFRCS